MKSALSPLRISRERRLGCERRVRGKVLCGRLGAAFPFGAGGVNTRAVGPTRRKVAPPGRDPVIGRTSAGFVPLIGWYRGVQIFLRVVLIALSLWKANGAGRLFCFLRSASSS